MGQSENRGTLFVARAASIDTYRSFMSGLHIEVIDGKKMVIATDGRRLHIAPYNEELEPTESCYATTKVLKARCEYQDKPTEGMFPNWQRVIPTEFTGDLISVVIPPRKDAFFSKAVYIIMRAMDAENYVNLNYIEDLGSFKWEWTMQISKNALLFTCGDYRAIIATMKM